MGADGGARQGESTRGITVALGGYLLLFVLKLTAHLATGVLALLAEALHTLGDILISGFLLLAARWSRRPPDAVHMFGYGRAQNVAALIAATLFISFTSYKLYEEAIPRLWARGAPGYERLGLALAVVLVSMAVSAVPLILLALQRGKGAAARAQFLESINDELGLLAALAGVLGIRWGYPLADPLAAIAVATLIAANALGLLRENACILLGSSPGPEFLRRAEAIARSVDGVLGVHELRAETVGPDVVHAGMHIEVQPFLPVAQAEEIAREVRRRLEAEAGCAFCVIHVDPAPVATGVAAGRPDPVGAATAWARDQGRER